MTSADPLPKPRARTCVRRLALWSGIGACALGLLAAHAFSQAHMLLLNVSPSLPNWGFWVERHRQPVRDDYVFFAPPSSALLISHFGTKPRLFGKIVKGVPGDLVTRHKDLVAVNGRIVARLKLRTRLGETLVPGPLGRIPPHCYFVATPHKDGFDSRYAAIGWVCARAIAGVGRPIL